MPPLRILHVLRAPVGGLFRHVIDLARAQAALSHEVGIVADANTGTTHSDAALAGLAPALALGVSRVPMSRHLGWSDIAAARTVAALVQETGAQVVHGHGAKGGAYARLARTRRAIRVYTPHGGSLHYRPSSPLGLLYLNVERLLMRRTDLFLFESAYSRDTFRAKVSDPQGTAKVVHNGVTEREFQPIVCDSDAADFVFVGELRLLKGVDVLLDALAILAAEGRRVSAVIVGAGPDAAKLKQQASQLDLANVTFAGPLPARAAFAKGRTLVVPSRAESLPYVVLEAAAARLPVIATRVGGIPEIFGPESTGLIPPGNAASLADALRACLTDPEPSLDRAERLQVRIRAQFSAEMMAEEVLRAYGEALSRRGLLASH